MMVMKCYLYDGDGMLFACQKNMGKKYNLATAESIILGKFYQVIHWVAGVTLCCSRKKILTTIYDNLMNMVWQI